MTSNTKIIFDTYWGGTRLRISQILKVIKTNQNITNKVDRNVASPSKSRFQLKLANELKLKMTSNAKIIFDTYWGGTRLKISKIFKNVVKTKQNITKNVHRK